ncbi:MAG: PspC domain-containing protein [Actinomycetota bacterium]|nr:MAG: phage shock protein [Actinomycetota bacterium]MDO8949376.1 PspC domain-containing protein [Actinomycetota bacterium]MDP3630500.1 PspC domain-containing protein [Actinomycetota bacterium]
MEKKLYRSSSDRMISGVCAGVADYFSIDPTLVRVGTVFLAVVTQGGIVLAYLIMSVVVPEEPEGMGTVEAAPHVQVPQDLEVLIVSESNGPVIDPGMPEPAAPEATSWAQSPAATTLEAPAKKRSTGRGVGFGLVLVLIGIILLVNEFVPGVDVWRFWPLLIVAVGLSAVFKGVRR